MWRSWLAHLLWEQGVPRSSRGTPTEKRTAVAVLFSVGITSVSLTGGLIPQTPCVASLRKCNAPPDPSLLVLTDTASAGPSDDGHGSFEPTFSVDPLRRFAPETRSTVFPDPALGGMPQMRIIGRGQYSTCRRGMFLRQIGRFCGRVGTRKALREAFSANASFIIPYVSVALLALLCALGGMKRVAWCFGAGVLDLWCRCDFWVGTCATRERLCPFPGAGSPLFPHLRQSMVTPAPPHG